MNLDWIGKVKELVAPVCEREGCKLYDIESSGSRSSRILKVFIDANDGVTIAQCANVSTALSLLLDVEDIVPSGKYSLEVSSPGLERNLRELWHYEDALNKVIKIKTHTSYMPIEGPETKKGLKLIKGVLTKIEDKNIFIEDDKSRVYQVILNDVTKAHTVYSFDNKKKKN